MSEPVDETKTETSGGDEGPPDAGDESPREEEGAPWYRDYSAVGTSLFFIGGFIFDAVTIGRYVNLYTLGYVGLYALAVAVCMVVRARRWFETWRSWVDNTLHFCLGAVFSALVCLYFRSAGHFWGFVGVALLAALMIYNEYAAHGRPRRTVVWGVFAVSLVMYFNFLAPYLFRSLSEWWFYLSIAATMGVLWWMRRLARIPARSLVASGVFSVVLMGLYAFGTIPPVPLVMKQQIVGVDARKSDGEYVCDVEDRPFWVDWGLVEPTVRWQPGTRVSVMSAVSAPEGVETKVVHRWQHRRDGSWKTYDTIELRMRGGRQLGWRFFSYKRNVLEGRWRVQTVVHDDWLLSTVEFAIAKRDGGEAPPRYQVRLE